MNSQAAEPTNLVVPCCYQGGKQRIASQVVDHFFEKVRDARFTQFYDLCCGSGAITIELLRRGISPHQITMLDVGSWGSFWTAVGEGRFDLERFRWYIDQIPADKSLVHDFAAELAQADAAVDECYKYLILQACSFGGKQIWREGSAWRNAFFRSYWLPTPSSTRRSPANPMQPGPAELFARVERIVAAARGIRCIHGDVRLVLQENIERHAIVYIDPPYGNTTSYGFDLDLQALIDNLKAMGLKNIFVSEGVPVSDVAVRLRFGGPKGGISGAKSGRHEEWLNAFGCA